MCKTEGCRKPAAKGRAECQPCRWVRLKAANAVQAAFKNLRSNALRRKKTFELTLDQFTEFCTRTGYLAGKGILKDSYHIDRIDESKGYSIDNIQLLTNSQNVRKALEYRWHGQKMEYTTNVSKAETEGPIPGAF